MKKFNFLVALSILTLSGTLLNTGCSEDSSGSSTTMRTSSFEGAQGKCTNSGVKIEVLVNGTVDDAQTQYICNGAQGQNGQDGQDGQDGQSGSSTTMKTTKFDGEQGDCKNGGVKIEFLVNGTVDEAQTQYICNGAQGQNGQDGQNGSNGKNASIQTTAFTGAQGTCTNGGVKVDILIDGVVQTGQTKYICNGANGQDGQDGQDGQNGSNGKNASIQTTAFTGAQGTCTNGGVKVDILIDGVVQAGQTQYICNGANVKDGEDASCDLTQAECNAHKTVLNKAKCQCSSYFTFGHYEQDTDTTNGKEPISWRILNMKDGKALIISEKTLDVQRYNTTEISITWEKSTIRSWLNGYDANENTMGTDFTINNFIDTAFTEAEKAKIESSYVEAHKNPRYSTSPGNATTDKIFLLSVTEANTYFPSDADRLADATPYTVKRGVSHASTCTNVQYSSSWWLRSPGGNKVPAFVRYDGSIQDNITSVANVVAVRPALWVNL